MFVVEALMTQFDEDSKVKEQNRTTRYFDDINDAMADYESLYEALARNALRTTIWDIFVISIFGGKELLKMQTIRCERE